MTGLLTISVFAFVLGMRHATDPDHVIAVSTIITRRQGIGRALAIGGAWGIGHSLTVLVVGSGVVLLGWVIPLRLELSMEMAVGVMLIVLGLASLDVRLPGGDSSRPRGRSGYGSPVRFPLARPLLIGVIHGLAGSAAVTLLVLATIPAPVWSLAYLAVFGVGTILGMMAITMAIAVPFAYPRLDSARWMDRIRLAAGLASVGFGLFLVYHVGVVEGLFAGAANGGEATF